MGRNITTHKNVEIKSELYKLNIRVHHISASLAVPSPTSVNITSNTTLPVWPMGAIITLNCTFELRPVVDVPVNITIEWIGPNGEILNSSHIGSNNRTVITITNTFRALAPGEYICNVSSIHSSSPYLIHSTPHQSGSFNITIGKKQSCMHTQACFTDVFLDFQMLLISPQQLWLQPNHHHLCMSLKPQHNFWVRIIHILCIRFIDVLSEYFVHEVHPITNRLCLFPSTDHDESNIIPLPVIVGSTVAVPVLLVCGCVIVIVAALQRQVHFLHSINTINSCHDHMQAKSKTKSTRI